MRVVIVGGGIGGLTLANSLKRCGVMFTVLEQAACPTESSTTQGYYIGVRGTGARALKEVGLAEGFADIIRPDYDGRFSFLTPDGETLLTLKGGAKAYDPHNEGTGTDGGRGSWPVHRGALHQLLLDGIDTDSVKWGSHVTEVHSSEESVSVVLEGGEVVEGDVLVGADGVHSVVRDALLGDELKDSGLAIVGGQVEGVGTKAFCPGDFMVMGSSGTGLFVGSYNSRGKEVTNFGFSFNVDTYPELKRLRDGPDLAATVSKVMESEGYLGALAQLPVSAPELRYRTLRMRPKESMDSAWPAGRVTLLGDAAHPMTPFAGQGANMAMDDAVRLGSILGTLFSGSYVDVHPALRSYEQAMKPKGENAVKISRNMATLIHTENGVVVAARNWGFRLMNWLMALTPKA